MLAEMMSEWIPGDRMSTKEIADWIKRVFDYDAVIVALVGSRAHGLATEDSDYDYIAFAEPTVEMIYRGEKVNEQFGIGEDIEVKLKDIRDLIPLLSAQNPNFLDIFLDKDSYVRRDYAWIFDYRVESFILSYDPSRLLRAAIGMGLNYLQDQSDKSLANAMYLNDIAYYVINFKRFPKTHSIRFTEEIFTKSEIFTLYEFEKIEAVLNGSLYEKLGVTPKEFRKKVQLNLWLLEAYTEVQRADKEYPEPDYQSLDLIERKVMDTLFASIF